MLSSSGLFAFPQRSNALKASISRITRLLLPTRPRLVRYLSDEDKKLGRKFTPYLSLFKIKITESFDIFVKLLDSKHREAFSSMNCMQASVNSLLKCIFAESKSSQASSITIFEINLVPWVDSKEKKKKKNRTNPLQSMR